MLIHGVCTVFVSGSDREGRRQTADLKADQLLKGDTVTVQSSLQRATIGEVSSS